MLMNTTRYAAAVLAVTFLALVVSASAQWSPGGAMVYMGDLNLVASSVHTGNVQKAPAGSAGAIAATNNTTQNSTSPNNGSTNATSTDNPVAINTAPAPSVKESSGMPVLDLSNYASDRTKSNLAGYTNIMYPITGSRGSTTSTAGGGGACGGCGQ
jgi:hypothetical protein